MPDKKAKYEKIPARDTLRYFPGNFELAKNKITAYKSTHFFGQSDLIEHGIHSSVLKVTLNGASMKKMRKINHVSERLQCLVLKLSTYFRTRHS